MEIAARLRRVPRSPYEYCCAKPLLRLREVNLWLASRLPVGANCGIPVSEAKPDSEAHPHAAPYALDSLFGACVAKIGCNGARAKSPTICSSITAVRSTKGELWAGHLIKCFCVRSVSELMLTAPLRYAPVAGAQGVVEQPVLAREPPHGSWQKVRPEVYPWLNL
jgi:hypothetical protein